MSSTSDQSDQVNVSVSVFKRRTTFGRRLAIYGSLLVVIAVGLCAVLAYFSRLETLKISAGSELLAIVNSTAAAIDGDMHERVHRNAKGEIDPMPLFDALHRLLVEVEVRNGLSGHGSPIYTLRKADDYNETGELEFVIMTRRERDGDFIVGSRYPVLPHLKNALAGIPAVTKIYEDDEGLWLSAAAPIRNHSGQVVAVVQADRPVNYFKVEAKRSAMWILSTAAVSVVIAWLLTWRYGKSMVRTVEELSQATRKIAEGDLSTRVKVSGEDELADLSRSFNHMTRELEEGRERDKRQREAMEEAHCETAEAKVRLEKANLELEKSYQEMSRLADAAQSANLVKTQFLSVMSHELRTPLNGVIGLASLLEQSGLDADSTDSAKTIRKSGENLLEIIENVLIYTELDRGNLGKGVAVFSVRDVVTEVAGRYVEEVALKGLRLDLDFAGSVFSRYRTDEIKLRRILSCLLSNAVKFTSDGSIRVEVRFEEETETEAGATRAGNAGGDKAGKLLVQVVDTGVGIRPEETGRLFQPFTQADGSMTRQYGGIGMGLVLVKQLSESMGGSVEYRPNVGQGGSTFQVTIPAEGSEEKFAGEARGGMRDGVTGGKLDSGKTSF